MSVGERLVPRFAERRWPQFAVAILGSVLSLGLLALLLLPSLTSVAAVEVVDGPETFAIGTAHEIEPRRAGPCSPSSIAEHCCPATVSCCARPTAC